jgi:hypothetical protein
VAELAVPEFWQPASGLKMGLIPIKVNDSGGLMPHEQALYETAGDLLYRVRYFSIVGHAIGGTVGSMVVTLQGLYSSQGPPGYFPAVGGLVAAADQNVQRGEDFLYTWATDLPNGYSNLDADFGRIWVGGIPLMWLPTGTQLSLLLSPEGGYDGGWSLESGELHIEWIAKGAAEAPDSPGTYSYLYSYSAASVG